MSIPLLTPTHKVSSALGVIRKLGTNFLEEMENLSKVIEMNLLGGNCIRLKRMLECFSKLSELILAFALDCK